MAELARELRLVVTFAAGLGAALAFTVAAVYASPVFAPLAFSAWLFAIAIMPAAMADDRRTAGKLPPPWRCPVCGMLHRIATCE
jgi:hypothetical protein